MLPSPMPGSLGPSLPGWPATPTTRHRPTGPARPQALALAGAGSIELGFHVGGGQMDVTGSGVDVRVTQQGLHHGQIDTSLGQRGAERVPQRADAQP